MRKNKILSDYNTVYYAANFRLRIYGRDQDEDNKITIRIEFKEKLPNCLPHLLNKVNPSFLSEFFTEYKEQPERKIVLHCEIVEDNKIRNQIVKFQLRKLKNVTIDDIIKFILSDKYKLDDNPEELIYFLKREYIEECKKVKVPEVKLPEVKVLKVKVPEVKVSEVKVPVVQSNFKVSDLKKMQINNVTRTTNVNKKPLLLSEYKKKQNL
jgi:hypothetical protein